MKKSNISRYIGLAVTLCFLLAACFPIYWMLNTSFKTQGEIYQRIPTFYPQQFSLEGYRTLLAETGFLNSLKNSLIVAFVVAFLAITAAYPASYAIARMQFFGKKMFARAILFCYLIPTSVLYIPLFILVNQFQLGDSLPGLILIYPTLTLPYASWILIPYVSSIPYELEESARVDGCSRLGTVYKICFPLALPGIVSTFIFSFSICWGEYMYALVNINSTENKTFPLMLSSLIFGDVYPWNQLMAGGILACLPIFFIYVCASGLLVGGLTAGGVKQ